MNDVTSKVALVFGGSRGIGAAIVERLAKDGYAVAFTLHRKVIGTWGFMGDEKA